MKIRSMKAIVLLLGILFLGTANAQYPNKPLRLVVLFAPGGSADIFARLLAERAQGPLGQPVVGENRAGSARGVGAHAEVSAAALGCRLLVGTTGVVSLDNLRYR